MDKNDLVSHEKKVHVIYIAVHMYMDVQYISCTPNAKQPLVPLLLSTLPPYSHVFTIQSCAQAVTPLSILVELTLTHIRMWVGS